MYGVHWYIIDCYGVIEKSPGKYGVLMYMNIHSYSKSNTLLTPR